jgi:hypothetical protein
LVTLPGGIRESTVCVVEETGLTISTRRESRSPEERMSIESVIDKHLHELGKDEVMQSRFVNGLMYGINTVLHKVLGDSANALNQRLISELGVEMIKLSLSPDEVAELEHDAESHDHAALEKLTSDVLKIVVEKLHLCHDIGVIASECDKTGNETREFEVHGCKLGPQAKKLEENQLLCAICPIGLILAGVMREAFNSRVRLVVREKKAGKACDLQISMHS